MSASPSDSPLSSPYGRAVAHPAFPVLFPALLWLAFTPLLAIHPLAVYVVYPIQVFAVLIALGFQASRLGVPLAGSGAGVFRPMFSFGAGLLAFAAWAVVQTVWPMPPHGLALPGNVGEPFNPYYIFGAGAVARGEAAFRLLGAGIVLPLVAEMAIRGWLMRRLIARDFLSVPLASFTPFSFLASTVAFALFRPTACGPEIAAALILGIWFLASRNFAGVLLASIVCHLLAALDAVTAAKWVLW
ncbi:CPBP family glutamic-type intramembrane protease [Verrucomicrobium sp. GAS474]|uniref:CPBP family glutamic-type intramembrane protease n=1 Tax=Verrucomicrobium sp. GAS474 TaxID=1882831 RepID=UPI000B840BDB|nr:CPBP family glutamic-type intramembrane protease [Verrucomicrobium sp. GAS474]